jgi:hypothetical protein
MVNMPDFRAFAKKAADLRKKKGKVETGPRPPA